MKNLNEISTFIINEINSIIEKGYGKTTYFTVFSENGKEIKIRIGDHSANKSNNGDTKTLSFITKSCNQGYRAMINEWVIDEDGYATTDETVMEILDNENVSDNQLFAKELSYEL